MSSPSSPTLICDVHSRHTERRVALLALAAPTSLVMLGTGYAFAFLLIAGLLIWLGLWWTGWVSAGHRIVRLVWLPDGRWLLTDRQSRTTEGALRADCRVGSRWVWLRWDLNRPFRARSMLLAAGDIAEDDLRRLIVRLRIDGAARTAAAPDNRLPDRRKSRGMTNVP